jgi:hypothetical protein
MASFNYNSNAADAVFYGANEVNAIYQGSSLVYTAGFTWSYVAGETNSNSSTINIPATAQGGDLCVLYDVTAVNGNNVTPAGWTSIISDDNTFENNFSYKVLTSGEPGSSVIGQNGTLYTVKIMMVFRPSTPVTVTTGTLQGIIETANNPLAITINTSAIVSSGLAIGVAKMYSSGALSTTGDANWNATSIYNESTSSTKTKARMFYKLQNAGSLTNPTLDMPDQGNYNTLFGIYFEGTPPV